MTEDYKGRPVSQTAPEAFARAADKLTALDALAALIDGAFAVLVKVSPGDAEPRFVRRVYLTAKAAEDAARKAAARGQSSRVYLCELKPLYRIEAAS